MSEVEQVRNRQLGGELVIPALAVAFTIYYFTTIWNSPWTAQVSAFLIGGILLGLCAAFTVKCVLAVQRGEASLGFGRLVGIDDVRSGRLALFAATLGYCAFIDRLGFTLATFLFLWISMMALTRGRNLVTISLASAAMALGGWAVFIWAFDTRFPRGWFETVMQGVIANG